MMKTDMQYFQHTCRRAGLKVTPQRMEIYRILTRSTQHPSAEMVFLKARKLIPNISIDTINRTLSTFNRIGVAFLVEGLGDARRFDANLKKHQHFKCVRCKRIVDFHYKPFDNIKTPPSLIKKFKILKKTVYLEGVCNLCLD